jgi:hypothetical protein
MSTISAWMRLLKRQTVRPRASVRIPLLACALIFAVTAIVVGRWGREHWIPVNRQTSYTATARAIETATGATTPFTSTDVDPQRAKASAGALAERYAAGRIAEWRRGKTDECQKTHDVAEKARQECRNGAALLSAFQRQRPERRSLPTASTKPPPQPAMIDNPAWLDLQTQVADLEGSRDQLLIDRTPLHPAVQEIDRRLAEAKEQLAATAHQIPDARVSTSGEVVNETALVPPAGDDPAVKQYEQKLAELTATLDKSRLACQDAERAEKQADQQLAAAPQFTFEHPEAVPNPLQVDYGWRRLLWTTFASSLLMVFGIVWVALGAGIDPAVASIDEVEDDLDEPVLGVLPSDGPPPNLAAIHRQAQLRRALIAFGTILILACPLVAAWGVLGL